LCVRLVHDQMVRPYAIEHLPTLLHAVRCDA
jgi:hypothetical protein